jgi:hypothetical protein
VIVWIGKSDFISEKLTPSDIELEKSDPCESEFENEVFIKL